LLDTGVLVYAVGVDHPLREPCRRLLEAVRLGRVTASTTPEVIQEFVHIHSQRRPREMAARLARGYVVGLAPLVLTEVEDVERGLRLFVEHAALGAFDSVLAAVALRTGAEAFISADRAFGAVRGLRYVDPAAPEFDRLLA
jgi:predicted nucleic acid-binding protein